MLTLQVQVSSSLYKANTLNFKQKEGFDGRTKLSDGRANTLPCPPLATPMILGNMKLSIQNYKYFEPALLVYKPSLISERFCVRTAQAFSA